MRRPGVSAPPAPSEDGIKSSASSGGRWVRVVKSGANASIDGRITPEPVK